MIRQEHSAITKARHLIRAPAHAAGPQRGHWQGKAVVIFQSRALAQEGLRIIEAQLGRDLCGREEQGGHAVPPSAITTAIGRATQRELTPAMVKGALIRFAPGKAINAKCSSAPGHAVRANQSRS